jgi:phage FluMu protein Com
MTYLRCPECRLTAHATAYYLQGDRCPRCLTVMEPAERFRDTPPVAAVAVVEDSRVPRAQPSAG